LRHGYFARLKNFVTYAAWSGVVVELVLFCQLYDDSMWSFSPMNIRNSVIGIGDGGPHGEEWTLRSARLD